MLQTARTRLFAQLKRSLRAATPSFQTGATMDGDTHTSPGRRRQKASRVEHAPLATYTFDDVQRDPTLLDPAAGTSSDGRVMEATASLARLKMTGENHARTDDVSRQRERARRYKERRAGDASKEEANVRAEEIITETENSPLEWRSRIAKTTTSRDKPKHSSTSSSTTTTSPSLPSRQTQRAAMADPQQGAPVPGLPVHPIERSRRREIDRAVESAQHLSRMEEMLKQEQIKYVSWAALDSSSSGQDTGSRLAMIGLQARKLWETTRLAPKEASQRQALLQDVERALARRWPGCHLSVSAFGSSMTGLVEASSDVDLCLVDPARPHGVGTPAKDIIPLSAAARFDVLTNPNVAGMPNLPDYYNVRAIARALEKHNFGKAFTEAVPIMGANVPIVKFLHCPSGLASDLNVNDIFGIRNSELISAYCSIAPHIVRPLIFAVKKWASRRGINDPAGKSGAVSLNSYTICLFVLQFLQMRGVVPNLQSAALVQALKVPQCLVWQKPPRSRSRRKEKTLAVAAPHTSTARLTNVVMDIGEDDVEPTLDEKQSAEGQVTIKDEFTGARAYDTTFADVAGLRAEQLAKELSQGSGGPAYINGQVNAGVEEASSGDVILGTLLADFFTWLSSLDLAKYGISLRLGQPFRREEGLETENDSPYPHLPTQNDKWVGSAMICQDPFITDRNTCGSITERVRDLIMLESQRAAEILQNGHEPAPSATAVQAETPLLSTLFGRGELDRAHAEHIKLLNGLKLDERELVASLAVQASSEIRPISSNGKRRRKPPPRNSPSPPQTAAATPNSRTSRRRASRRSKKADVGE